MADCSGMSSTSVMASGSDATKLESGGLVPPVDCIANSHGDTADTKVPSFFGLRDDLATLSLTEQQQDLVKKGMTLLGLSERFEGTERGAQLAADSERLLSWAGQLKASLDDSSLNSQATEAAEAAQAFLDELRRKYDGAGGALLAESQALWDSLSSSEEATALAAQGVRLLDQWREFGASDQGKDLIQAAGHALGDSGADLIKELANMLAQGEPGTGTGSGSGSGTTGDGAKLAGALAVGHERLVSLAEQLRDDEDAILLLDKGRALVDGFSQQAQAHVHAQAQAGAGSGASPARGSRSRSRSGSSSGAGSAANTGVGAESEPGAGSEHDPLVSAAAHGTAYLSELRQSNAGRELLRRGTDALGGLQGDLSPEAVVGQGRLLLEDSEARLQLLSRVKDAALGFLMDLLPSVEVPPLSGEKEGLSYDLDGLDLRGFRLQTEHVTVEVTDKPAPGLLVRARHMTCIMQNVTWKFKQLGFPWAYGSGAAEANAEEIDFVLRLEIVKKRDKQTPQAHIEPVPELRSPERKAHSGSRHGLDSLNPASPARKHILGACPSPVKSGPLLTLPGSDSNRGSSSGLGAGPGPGSDSGPGSRQDRAQSMALGDKPEGMPRPRSQSHSQGVPVTQGTAGADEPELVLGLRECNVRLGKLRLTIKDSWFASVLNVLITLFGTEVRTYVEDSLNETLRGKSGELLAQINALAQQYLPVLVRLTTKSAAILTQQPIEAVNQQIKSRLRLASAAAPASPSAAPPGNATVQAERRASTSSNASAVHDPEE